MKYWKFCRHHFLLAFISSWYGRKHRVKGVYITPHAIWQSQWYQHYRKAQSGLKQQITSSIHKFTSDIETWKFCDQCCEHFSSIATQHRDIIEIGEYQNTSEQTQVWNVYSSYNERLKSYVSNIVAVIQPLWNCKILFFHVIYS